MKSFYLTKGSAILLFLIFSTIKIHSQEHSNCPNSDFSQGTFNNWSAFTGDFDNPAILEGLEPNRQTIIAAPGDLDYNTCNQLLTVPSGAAYSARLGNSDINREAEQLRYTLSVNETTNLFIYKYAVVLQDPSHDAEEQPSFTIEVTNQNGQLIDPVCGYYYVYAQQGMPGWNTCNSVVWKDWTTVGIDLTPYMGQTISIVFTTRDCNQGGHYGYAYISAYCSKLEIVYGYCPNDTVAYVTAPPGFSYQWANGATTQSTIVYHPEYGKRDSCILTSANGCQVMIEGSFKPTIVEAEFSYPPTCVGAPMQFTDESKINQNQIVGRLWDFGDGSPLVSGVDNPQHIYHSPGPFLTKLIAYSTDGCPDTLVKAVEAVEVPVVTFSIDHSCAVKKTWDTIYYDKQTLLHTQNHYDHFQWSTGDTTSSISVYEEGWYSITIDNNRLCYSTDSVMMLECYIDFWMPNAFTPNGDGHNDLFRPVTIPEKVFNFRLMVYDKWGMKLFESQNPSVGWDGYIDGNPAQMGVYGYVILYNNPAGELKQARGSFTLLI
jgi:gliding motility-associated-like protein